MYAKLPPCIIVSSNQTKCYIISPATLLQQNKPREETAESMMPAAVCRFPRASPRHYKYAPYGKDRIHPCLKTRYPCWLVSLKVNLPSEFTSERRRPGTHEVGEALPVEPLPHARRHVFRSSLASLTYQDHLRILRIFCGSYIRI